MFEWKKEEQVVQRMMVYLENTNIFKASLDFTLNAKFSLDVLVFLLEARIEDSQACGDRVK